MSTIEDRLRRTASAPVDPPDFAAIISHSHRIERRRRRRLTIAAGGVAATAGILAISFGWGVLRDDARNVITESRDSTPAEPVESPPEPAPAPQTPEVTETPDSDQSSPDVVEISVAPLPPPTSGETQSSIVGDITWTLLQGDSTTQPARVRFEIEGVFYGEDDSTDRGWWRSPDGVAWTRTDPISDGELGSIFEVGDQIWATTDAGGEKGALVRWNGTAFERVDLVAWTSPTTSGVPAERSVFAAVGFGDDVVIHTQALYEPGVEARDELLIGDAEGFEVVAWPLPPGRFGRFIAVDDRLFAVNQSRRPRPNGTLMLGTELWTSADARSWSQVELPVSTGEANDDSFFISSDADGVLVVEPNVGDPDPERVWRSTDGVTWDESDRCRAGETDVGYLRTLETDEDPFSFYVSDDCVTWQEIPIDISEPDGLFGVSVLADTIFVASFTYPSSIPPDPATYTMWVGVVEDRAR